MRRLSERGKLPKVPHGTVATRTRSRYVGKQDQHRSCYRTGQHEQHHIHKRTSCEAAVLQPHDCPTNNNRKRTTVTCPDTKSAVRVGMHKNGGRQAHPHEYNERTNNRDSKRERVAQAKIWATLYPCCLVVPFPVLVQAGGTLGDLF